MMNEDQEHIVRVASGTLVQIELWQQRLKEAGIESKVVGENLAASFGTALTDSVELWVHESDQEKALASIRFAEAEMGHRTDDDDDGGDGDGGDGGGGE